MTTKKVKVVHESDSGLNQKFLDPSTKKEMTRKQFADAIEKGQYPGYHVMRMNNKRIPRSNPDRSKNNNLD
ncbi:hypothetical protein V7127_02500 [Bacillus sp. JJ1773]|uniref:DUF3892 domain-containing protein n=1 Tax=Bacillus sp. JJ1773 TaxID=3122965 RepID=UPI002FFEC2CE